jgi:hypothetical protein
MIGSATVTVTQCDALPVKLEKAGKHRVGKDLFA